jgi:hypothetical protein
MLMVERFSKDNARKPGRIEHALYPGFEFDESMVQLRWYWPRQLHLVGLEVVALDLLLSLSVRYIRT